MHKVNIHTILFYSVIFCATTFGISSCSDTEKSPTKHSGKSTKIVPSVLEQPSPMAIDTLAPETLTPITQDPETLEPSKPLDLSLFDSPNGAIQPTAASIEPGLGPDLLPDLFTNKSEIVGPRVSGRLITDEKKEDLVDSIDGVEISIDFQIP